MTIIRNSLIFFLILTTGMELSAQRPDLYEAFRKEYFSRPEPKPSPIYGPDSVITGYHPLPPPPPPQSGRILPKREAIAYSQFVWEHFQQQPSDTIRVKDFLPTGEYFPNLRSDDGYCYCMDALKDCSVLENVRVLIWYKGVKGLTDLLDKLPNLEVFIEEENGELVRPNGYKDWDLKKLYKLERLRVVQLLDQGWEPELVRLRRKQLESISFVDVTAHYFIGLLREKEIPNQKKTICFPNLRALRLKYHSKQRKSKPIIKIKAPNLKFLALEMDTMINLKIKAKQIDSLQVGYNSAFIRAAVEQFPYDNLKYLAYTTDCGYDGVPVSNAPLVETFKVHETFSKRIRINLDKIREVKTIILENNWECTSIAFIGYKEPPKKLRKIIISNNYSRGLYLYFRSSLLESVELLDLRNNEKIKNPASFFNEMKGLKEIYISPDTEIDESLKTDLREDIKLIIK